MTDDTGGWCPSHARRSAHWPEVLRWEVSQICRDAAAARLVVPGNSSSATLEQFVQCCERAVDRIDAMFGVDDPQQPVPRQGRAGYGPAPSFASLADVLPAVAPDGQELDEPDSEVSSLIVGGPLYALLVFAAYNPAVTAPSLSVAVEFRMLHVAGTIVSVDVELDDDEVLVVSAGAAQRTFLPPLALAPGPAELYRTLRQDYGPAQAAELAAQLGG